MKKNRVVLSLEPSRQTDYPITLPRYFNYVVFIGAVCLTVIALIPLILSGVFNASVSFGATSIIIIVGVVLETVNQIESMMLVRHCKGLFNE